MEEKLKITKENGKYFVVFPSGSKVVMTEEANKKIMDLVSSVIVNEFSFAITKEEETKPIKKKAEKRVQVHPTRREIEEKYIFIANLYNKGLSSQEIITELMDKHYSTNRVRAANHLYEWRKKVGLKEKSTPFSRYLAEHNYEVENVADIAEQFGMSPGDVKERTFRIRCLRGL